MPRTFSAWLVCTVCFSSALALPGARYLIITADALAGAVQPLAEWKTTKGMAARVVPLSEAGTTPAAIKAYILNAYQNWPVRPEFVLLVGSPTLVPSYQSWDDGYYGNMVGNRLVELPVGRLPAATARECSTMAAKILAYENPAPGADSTWYLKGTTVVREDVPPDAYYMADARLVHNWWLGAGYTMVESLSNVYGDSSTDVNAAGSEGRAFVLYRGQATATWYTPFHQVTFGSWTNGTKLPVIVSATCYTVTLAPGESFYGDQAVRAGTPAVPAGAVAFFGPSRGASSVSRYRSAAARGFFRALFEENRFRLGDACLRGKFAVDSLYGDSVRYIEWNLLGDPELNVWTGVPRRPTVVHDTAVSRDSTVFQVEVRASGAPVANALVCVAMDSTVYEYGETDDAGRVQLVICPLHSGNLTVTVTGRNLRPYQGTCRVTGQDIACTRVVAPVGVIDSGTVVTPECELFNAGSTTETYPVRMRFGGTYDQTVVVVGHPAGTTRRVQFASWTALRRGTFAVRCSCSLTGDRDSTNNLAVDSVSVRVRDVGVAVLVAPRGGVLVGLPVVPACTVRNYGTSTEDYQVRMTIGADYCESVAVAGHPAGTSQLVQFPTWLAGPPGALAVRCSTELGPDQVKANDWATALIAVDFVDVMVKAVLRPFLVGRVGQVVIPRLRIGNSGGAASVCGLRVEIYDPANVLVYAAADTGLVVEPAAVLEHDFARPWVPAATGAYRIVAFVSAMGDTCQANDTLRSTCTVRTGTIGWQSGPALVSGAGPVGAGGWLAGAEGDLRFYAAKGNRTAEFYSFDPVSIAWTTRQSLPALPDGQLPGKGAAGCSDGQGWVYAVKGNNTLSFYRYRTSADSWQTRADVPLGTYRKKVKAGTDLVFAPGPDSSGPGSVYLLKGPKDEFYRYDPGRDAWQTLASPPAGRAPKWNLGSWLVSDGDSLIYAHKAKYHDFCVYNLKNNTWSSKPSGMPLVSRITGKSKESKDGGCATWFESSIYALKGGSTQEFWQYTPRSDSWHELDTMPQVGTGGKKKKVKAGADIVGLGGVLYALKGNKTLEFWQYVPQTLDAVRLTPDAGGVVTNVMRDASDFVRLSPNPLRTGCTTLRLSQRLTQYSDGPLEVSIIDVSGRLVFRSSFATRTSSLPLDLRGLSAGVYAVRLSSGSNSVTRKLVVQH